MAHLLTEVIGTEAIDGGPDDSPCGIECEKALPVHAIGTGEKRREATPNGNKAPEEDHSTAVPKEQILPELDPALRQPDIAPEADQKPGAEFAPDPEAQIVPESDPERRCGYHEPDIQGMIRPCDSGCGDEDRFARQRYSHAFQGDEAPDGTVPVSFDNPQ
jgi:hypothetical protein